MRAPNTPTVDVCLLLEGTYPYVSGGVSTWVHQIISAMPEVTFGIFYIGGQKDAKAVHKYRIPKNVVVFEELYLFDPEPPSPARREMSGSWSAFYSSLRSLLGHAPTGQAGELDHLATLVDHLLRHPHLRFADFYHAPHSWSLLQELYDRYSPDESFLPYFWTARYLIEPLWKLIRALPRVPKARVYHTACTGYAGFLGTIASQRHGTPLLLSEHGIYLRERIQDLWRSRWIPETPVLRPLLAAPAGSLREGWMRFFDVLARWCYHRASTVVSLFNENAAIQHHFGALPSKTVVVPNGIAAEACEPLYQQRLDRRRTNPQSRVVGFLGRIVPIKDVKTLLRAARRVCDALPDTRFVLSGPTEEDPDYAHECHDLCAQLGLEENVAFLGMRPREEVLPLMDVMVLTSVSEGLPFVMLEAMACGIPTVTTDVGACRELIEGHPTEQPRLGACGLVTEAGESDQIAQALITLLLSHEVQDRAGAIGRERVYRTYHEHRTLGGYWELYRRLAYAAPSSHAAPALLPAAA